MARSYADAHFISNFSGQLNDDFHKSQHKLSRYGHRLLMWKVVQAWDLY